MRKKWIRMTAGLAVTALLLTGAMFVFARSVEANRAITAASLKTKETVIIDAGHGGMDGGASVDDVCERELNLLVATELQIELLLRGYDVIMTREDSEALAETKRDDMRLRYEIAQANPQAIFVSVHMNKFSDKSCRGAQVFYGQKNNRSLALAETISVAIKESLQPDNERLPKRGGNDIYLLKNITNPAVIVECGFISNVKELANLCDPDYQTSLALCIADGIDSYFSGK